ncbi:MAG: adenylyl-sulfate kinase [Candidatus Entotheonellia bacterium]
MRTLNISCSELRRRLAEGREIPRWFTFSDVATELQHSYAPRQRQGFTVFFIGLSGAGKSTIANVLLLSGSAVKRLRSTTLPSRSSRSGWSSALEAARAPRSVSS